MDQKKVTDYLFLIKYPVDSQETLLEYQCKVDAMLEMVLARDLMDHPELKLRSYMWALSDAIGRAKSFSEDLMGALNRITTLLIKPENAIFEK